MIEMTENIKNLARGIDFSFLEKENFSELDVDPETLKEDLFKFVVNDLAPRKREVFERRDMDEIQDLVESSYAIHLKNRIKIINSVKRSEWDMDGDCRRRWIKSLFAFDDFLKSRGYDTFISSDMDWYNAGYNVVARKGKISFHIKLKTREKLDRKDAEVDDDWAWVEITDPFGEKGWLYKNADIIAFEVAESYIFVEREKLKKAVEPMIDRYLVLKDKIDILKHYITKGRIPMYSRMVRKEEIALVPMKIIKEIGTSMEKTIVSKEE